MDDDGPPETAPLPPSKKQRAMDSFLDELKRRVHRYLLNVPHA